MVAKQDIELLFGVAGGGKISGASGDNIKKQLTDIATSLNNKTNSKLWKIAFSLDVPKTKKNLSDGLKDILKNLGEQKQFKLKIGSINATAAINGVKKELNAMLKTLKVDTGFTVTMGTNGATSAVKEVAGASQEAVLSLSQVDGALEEINGTNRELNKSYRDLWKTLSQKGDVSSIEQIRDAFVNVLSLTNDLKTNKATASVVDVNVVHEAQQALEALIGSLKRQEQAERDATQATKDAEKARLNNEKTVASMHLQLSKFNDYLATLNPKALTEFAAQIENIRTLLGSKVPENAREAATAINELKAQIKEAGYEGGNIISFVADKIRAFGVYLISSKLTTGVVEVFNTVIENVKTLDEALTDLRIVTGNTEKDTEKLLQTYSKMAQTLGATTSNVSSAAIEWQRQGYNDEDTNTLVEDSTVLSVVGMVESADAAQYLTSAIKGYKVEVEEAISIVDKLTAVDMKAAVSAGGLAEAMARTANSARLAGVDMSSLIGYIAAVGEVTQRDMTTVGEAFKTVFARYSNVKLGQLTDSETGESLNDFEKSLKAVGIALRDSEGEFRDFNDVVLEVGEAWSSLSSIEQSAIATTLGGVRQRENILVLFENLDKALEYAGVAAEASGTAMEKFGVYQESLEAKTASATAAFEEFSMTLLDSDLLGWIMDLGTLLFNALSLFDAVPAKITAIGAAAVILKGIFDSTKVSNFGVSIKKTISDLG